jgi:hypothetical protein
MKTAPAIDTLVHTFLSDDQLIEYIARDVRKCLKENRSQHHLNCARIVTQTIDRTFDELHLSELVATFLERTTPKILLPAPEYSESEPTKFSKSKRKGKRRQEESVSIEEQRSVKIDFNETQYINPERLNFQLDESTQSETTFDRDNSPNKEIANQDVEYPQKESQLDPISNELDLPTEEPISPHPSPTRDLSQDEYSIQQFEGSPETIQKPDTETIPKSRHVNFVDGLISDTFIHREKHTPEEVPDLFYTHDESIKFQYDYDREAQRADSEGISWLNWMMKRTEEERKKHEEEDDLLQHEYQDYWEGNEQYDEESQSGDEMWEF